MTKIIFVAAVWLGASIFPVYAADVGHDCAEGADEYIVADTELTPPAGV